MQHVQPAPQADPAAGVRGAGEEDQGRVRGQGFLELGSVGGDAVLPTRAGALAARDRGWPQELRRQARTPGHRGAGALVAQVCELAFAALEATLDLAQRVRPPELA